MCPILGKCAMGLWPLRPLNFLRIRSVTRTCSVGATRSRLKTMSLGQCEVHIHTGSTPSLKKEMYVYVNVCAMGMRGIQSCREGHSNGTGEPQALHSGVCACPCQGIAPPWHFCYVGVRVPLLPAMSRATLLQMTRPQSLSSCRVRRTNRALPAGLCLPSRPCGTWRGRRTRTPLRCCAPW